MRDKKTKKIRYAFGIWEVDQEIALLNKYSAEGWHFERSCFIGAVLKKDDSVVYRYQIDYHPKADQRYYDTFRELGWEHVAVNGAGYHYFRKVYDPSKDESEYEIYTDTDSYRQAFRGQTKKCFVFATLYSVIALLAGVSGFSDKDIVVICCAAVYLICAVGFGIVLYALRRKVNDRNSKSVISGKIILWVTILLSVAFLTVPGYQHIQKKNTIMETNISWEGTVEETDGANSEDVTSEVITQTLDFTIDEAREYNLDLDYSCEKGDISFEIVNDAGKVIFTVDSTDNCSLDNEKILFDKGSYCANVYASNECEDVSFKINIARPWFSFQHK